MEKLNHIAEQNECTVVARYEVPERKNDVGQSEAEMESNLIKKLVAMGYEYVDIKSEDDLLANLRVKIEQLNDIEFSDGEWMRLLHNEIAREGDSIEEKAQIIQQNEIVDLELDSGRSKNIKLIDKRNIYNNCLQVINQYTEEHGDNKNRYDVTILVNGLPLVHVELKKRGVNLKEAFNQINRYQRDSFWAGCGLFEYVQIFVVSNGTQTKYYSNTTRNAHVRAQQNQQQMKVKTECHSYEFTSYWSDAENKILYDLRDFADTFFARRTLLNVLTRYCVFTVDKNLLVMRPYQIAATEKILTRVNCALKSKLFGKMKGGFVWHTTGSGKTLTSFKTAQLASRMDGIDKVLFVVDRQDLDYQTMKEYDNFEKGCANSNSSSVKLMEQLNDPMAKIIITTIQKLNSLINRGEAVEAYNQNVVMIFDECHRSQFGEMHNRIANRFKRSMMFGFTGTPIFKDNAIEGNLIKTTAQVFGGAETEDGKEPRPLHTYTIVNAINDGNVLKFRVNYWKKTSNLNVKTLSEEKKMERRRWIVENILETYGALTKRNERYGLNKMVNVSEVVKNRRNEEQRIRVGVYGFNGLFAVDSVDSAIAYYNEFKRQQEGVQNPLKVATIFTYGVNEEVDDETSMGFIPDENPDRAGELTKNQFEALEAAVLDYNEMFKTNYSAAGDGFQNYYKDVSLRMKNKEIDLVIVVGMFLTGFDAKTLNTLWVDKNLKMHGLLQAFSRTNRILNAVKTYGNIVCYRDLEERVNESIALFSDKDAGGIILIRDFETYYEKGYTDNRGKVHRSYKELVKELRDKYPVDQLGEIKSETKQKEFIKLFGEVLRDYNLLEGFVEQFDKKARLFDEKKMELQNYMSWYNDLHDKYRKEREDKKEEEVEDDLQFEMELVKQVQMDIDYIMELVKKYKESKCSDNDVKARINNAIGSSPDLRDKKDLVNGFMSGLTDDIEDVYAHWIAYVKAAKKREFDTIVHEERLREREAEKFLKQAFEDGFVTEIGTALVKVMPPMPFFGGNVDRESAKRHLVYRLKQYVNKYSGLY